MPESIKDKTVKGVGWSAIDSIAGNSVSFIIGVILARLLLFLQLYAIVL